MDITAYRDEIRLKLTGSVLELELEDSTLDRIINAALREVQRYITTTKLALVKFKGCIDLTDCGVNSVVKVYRADAADIKNIQMQSGVDPLYVSQQQILGGGGMGINLSNWVYNYAAWNTMGQIRNTMSTDLAFRYDKSTNYLYVNCSYNRPEYITVEYVPRYDDVSQVVSDYWIDIIVRLAVAITKTTVGRVRSRYTQSNALWTQDGEALLEEGNAELEALRQHLVDNTQLMYPID